MSPQHLLTGAASPVLPCILSVLRACCHGQLQKQHKKMVILKYELWRTMRTSEAWMIAEITTEWATEDSPTAFPHFLPSSTSETPDICSASDLRLSFYVIFIYLCSSSVYLLLSRWSVWPSQQISLVRAAALPCLFWTQSRPHKRLVEYLLSNRLFRTRLCSHSDSPALRP